jgi:hypothetical protein
MALNDLYQVYKKTADGIPGWQKLTKSQLANGYCDADDNHDEVKRSQFYAALMCKYWYMITYMRNHCQSISDNLNMSLEDFADWLSESLDVAFKYRRWRNPDNSLFKDPNSPETVINRCIFSTQKRWYAYFNKDKRRANIYAYSLEESESLHGDSCDGLGIEDKDNSSDYCHDIIQHLLDKGKIFEAFIVDGICYQDVFKSTIKRTKTGELDENQHSIVYTNTNETFSARKLIKHLTSLDDNYLEYLTKEYNITNQDLLLQTIKEVKTESHIKLNYKLKKVLVDMKSNEEILELLC